MSLLASKPKNKDRIYLAFFLRGRQPGETIKYHTGLIIAPKNPDTSTRYAYRYHANNNRFLDNGSVEWQYEINDVQSRTHRCVAYVLLGKRQPTVTLEQLDEWFKAVPLVQGDPNWRCRHWAWAAMDVCAC